MNPLPPVHSDLAALLIALGKAGVELALHPELPNRLRHRPSRLGTDVKQWLRTHRSAAVALLTLGYMPTGDDAHHDLVERLGIADELGMPTHPGSTAWLLAVGESLLKEPA